MNNINWRLMSRQSVLDFYTGGSARDLVASNQSDSDASREARKVKYIPVSNARARARKALRRWTHLAN